MSSVYRVKVNIIKDKKICEFNYSEFAMIKKQLSTCFFFVNMNLSFGNMFVMY